MHRIGKVATSKVAGRKAMGVRVPLPPHTCLPAGRGSNPIPSAFYFNVVLE